MKRTLTAVITALAMLIPAATAFAQSPLPEVGVDEPDAELVKKVTEYDYDDDTIEGTFDNPLGSVHRAELHKKLGNLIDIRADFTPELIKSTEDL